MNFKSWRELIKFLERQHDEFISSVPKLIEEINKQQHHKILEKKESRIYVPEKESGTLGMILFSNSNSVQIEAMVIQRATRLTSLKTAVEYRYFFDYYIERLRTLFQIALYNVIRKTQIEVFSQLSFGETFNMEILRFLIRSPRPINGDLSEIIYKPEMTVEEYKEDLYPISVGRLITSSSKTENQAQTILDKWLPTLQGETLLEFVTYLYPITQPKAKEEILADNERMWMYLYSLGMWYKLRFSLGKLYDDLDTSEIPDLETFLTGQDLPDNPLRQQV
jgi:hypothetical protein